jgi:hypothetical protein
MKTINRGHHSSYSPADSPFQHRLMKTCSTADANIARDISDGFHITQEHLHIPSLIKATVMHTKFGVMGAKNIYCYKNTVQKAKFPFFL